MNNFNRSLIFSLLIVVVGGCASANYESRVEQDFGEAVREMVRLQTLDPDAEERNAGAAPAAIDGAATEKVMDTYRNRASRQESITNDIEINVGN